MVEIQINKIRGCTNFMRPTSTSRHICDFSSCTELRLRDLSFLLEEVFSGTQNYLWFKIVKSKVALLGHAISQAFRQDTNQN